MAELLSKELQAMSQIEVALKDLDEEERARVMQWANSRFRGTVKAATSGKMPNAMDGTVVLAADHEELAGFFSAASPKTDADKALVTAYWLQYKENVADIDTQTVNTRLKHLGHGIGNITRAFDALKAEKPALIVQTKKEGTSQQARKKFRVTNEGKKKVEAMLADGA